MPGESQTGTPGKGTKKRWGTSWEGKKASEEAKSTPVSSWSEVLTSDGWEEKPHSCLLNHMMWACCRFMQTLVNWGEGAFLLQNSIVLWWLLGKERARARKQAGQGERERESQAGVMPTAEPNRGLDLTTPRSWPEPKSGVDASPTKPPRCPPDSTVLIRFSNRSGIPEPVNNCYSNLLPSGPTSTESSCPV